MPQTETILVQRLRATILGTIFGDLDDAEFSSALKIAELARQSGGTAAAPSAAEADFDRARGEALIAAVRSAIHAILAPDSTASMKTCLERQVWKRIWLNRSNTEELFEKNPRYSLDEAIHTTAAKRAANRWKSAWKLPAAAAFERSVAGVTREAAEIAACIQSWNNGEREAFEALRARFSARVRAAARRIRPRFEDQEEIEQDVWVKLALLPLDPCRALELRGLLRVMTVQAAYDHWKRDRKTMPPEDWDVLETTCQPASLEYDLLLQDVFAGEVPPHQVLSFAFTKILGFTPREIWSEDAGEGTENRSRTGKDFQFGDFVLADLLEEFLERYPPGAMTRPRLLEITGPTRDRMPQELRHVLQGNARNTYRSMWERICGATTLRDYAVNLKSPVKLPLKIPAWNDAVRDTLRRKQVERLQPAPTGD